MADPPNDPMVAVAQDTFTAEIGTVGQLVNIGALACTLRFQLLPPEITLHAIVAVELPATTGAVAGLVAAKVMVAGLTVGVKFPAVNLGCAKGRGFPAAIMGRPAAKVTSNAMEILPLIRL